MARMCDESGRDNAPLYRISHGQCLAIAALASGESVYEASLSAGVRSRATVYRWLRKPHFLAALRRVREERVRPFVEMKKLIDDPSTEPHIRVRAAENLRDMVKEPERDVFTHEGHDGKVVRSILAILP